MKFYLTRYVRMSSFYRGLVEKYHEYTFCYSYCTFMVLSYIYLYFFFSFLP